MGTGTASAAACHTGAALPPPPAPSPAVHVPVSRCSLSREENRAPPSSQTGFSPAPNERVARVPGLAAFCSHVQELPAFSAFLPQAALWAADGQEAEVPWKRDHSPAYPHCRKSLPSSPQTPVPGALQLEGPPHNDPLHRPGALDPERLTPPVLGVPTALGPQGWIDLLLVSFQPLLHAPLHWRGLLWRVASLPS